MTARFFPSQYATILNVINYETGSMEILNEPSDFEYFLAGKLDEHLTEQNGLNYVHSYPYKDGFFYRRCW
jgi:hypothetical protein